MCGDAGSVAENGAYVGARVRVAAVGSLFFRIKNPVLNGFLIKCSVMKMEQADLDLCRYIVEKDAMKRAAAENTLRALGMLKERGRGFFEEFGKLRSESYPQSEVQIDFSERGALEFTFRFSSDVLLFTVHTNVFEFSRNHEVMKTPYIKEDPNRSFCGVIHIYNFLADSLQYGRENDLGYLIGRVFINKENHYFIEGKKELGLIYSAFGHSVFDEEAACKLLRAAMEYTAKFDLLTPPYDEMKEITVGMVQDELAYKKMRTGKRLGFQFKADQ